MAEEIGPEQAKINAHFAAVRDDLAALQRGKAHAATEVKVKRTADYLREQLPDDTELDVDALARRAVNAARTVPPSQPKGCIGCLVDSQPHTCGYVPRPAGPSRAGWT